MSGAVAGPGVEPDSGRLDGACGSMGPGGPPVEQPPAIRMARAVIDALHRVGVHGYVLAPGSRSAPFIPVIAAAEERRQLLTRVAVDERSAGFMALGANRALDHWGRGGLTAVLTTSGTAVANLHPAVLEADAAGIPLIVVTADRPHELVGTGANQTAEQTRLFDGVLRAVVDLPADLTGDLGLAAAESAIAGQVRRALLAACGEMTRDPGPVQLNVRFRPPLAPAIGPDGAVPDEALALSPPPGPRRPVRAIRIHEPGGIVHGSDRPVDPVRGVVVAGDQHDRTIALRLRRLAEQLDWPLLAEPTSMMRGGTQALTRYAELLATPAGRALADRVERVIVAGHPTLSRSIAALLARRDIPIDVVASTARITDVAGTVRAIVSDPPGGGPLRASGLGDLAAALDAGPAPSGWMRCWRDAVAALPELEPLGEELTADAVALSVYDSCVPDPPEDPARGGRRRFAPMDPRSRLVAAPDPCPRLVLGSSLTIRRLDRLARPTVAEAPRVFANRGLAGIDGTLATAVGMATGRPAPGRPDTGPATQCSGRAVRALIGDLTFLHDAMSLNRGRCESEPDLQVIVVDDAGGAIFSTLEYSAVTPARIFDRFFTAPQRADVPALARALGARVHQPTTLSELRHVLTRPVGGLSVVHTRVAGRGGG